MEDATEAFVQTYRERLKVVYFSSIEHHGTDDLILMFDDRVKQIVSFDRRVFINNPNIQSNLPDSVRVMQESAREHFKASHAFWFIFVFPNGRVTTCPVMLQTLSPGGTA